jgi:hypothetical protein
MNYFINMISPVTKVAETRANIIMVHFSNLIFNRLLAFILNMSENLELCPNCKQGHLRDPGDVAVKVEIQPPFRQTGSSRRERICDHCGHRQIDQYLNEYGEPESDLLSGTATKPNPEEKREG